MTVLTKAELATLKGEIDAAEAAGNWGEAMKLKQTWMGHLAEAGGADGLSAADRALVSPSAAGPKPDAK